MPGLDDIVRVVIRRGSKTVSRAGFGTPMVLGLHTRFSERHRTYTSLAGMISDGFLTSDSEYKAAAAIFGQEISPPNVFIGRRTAAVAQVVTFTPTVLNNQLYTATINGVDHTFTSDGSALAAEIVTGLAAAINGGSQAAKVTATGTSTLIVTSDGAGEAFTYAGDTNLVPVLTTASHGTPEDIDAIVAELGGDDWYALILTSHSALDIRVTAAKIETMKKLYLAATADADVITSVSTDVGSLLAARKYARTALIYSGTPGNYLEAAWAAVRLPLDPGSETWKFANNLAGQVADNLSDSAIANLKAKFVNYYVTVAGNDIVENGQVSANEWIDVIRGIDWLEARMKERIFGRLISVPKIPYTDNGVAIIEADVRAQLTQAVRVGLLAGTPEYTVTVPKVADVDPADKAARLLPDVKFDGTLAGAIHELEIDGVVSV